MMKAVKAQQHPTTYYNLYREKQSQVRERLNLGLVSFNELNLANTYHIGLGS